MRTAVHLVLVATLAMGASLRAQGTGSLTGIVRDERSGPIAGVEVILPGYKLRDTTNEAGRYSIPVVPAGPTLLVGRKTGWQEHSAAVRIAISASKEYNFTLTAALDTPRVAATAPQYRPAAQAGISGVVREDSSGRPVSGASVLVEALRREVSTDAQGRYQLVDLPAGANTITIRKVGLVPTTTGVEIRSGMMLSRDLALARAPVMLDTMLVKDKNIRAFGIGLEGFEERRQKGFGKFIDSTELRKNEHRTLGDMLRTIPGITLANPPYCGQPYGVGELRLVRRINCVVSRNHLVALSGPLCAIQVSVDGTTLIPSRKIDNSEPPLDPANDWTSTININTLLLTDVTAVEVYRRNGEIPMEYRGSTECGLLLVWTRRGR